MNICVKIKEMGAGRAAESHAHFNEKVQQSTTFPRASQENDCTDSEKSKVIAQSLRHSWLREKKVWPSNLHSSIDYENKPVFFFFKKKQKPKNQFIGITYTISSNISSVSQCWNGTDQPTMDCTSPKEKGKHGKCKHFILLHKHIYKE